MAFSLRVDNIKCGGCANTIRKRLLEIEGISEVKVTVEEGLVEVVADDSLREKVATTLASSGYPESGTVEGLSSVKAKAVSFVSCAIGRMDRDK